MHFYPLSPKGQKPTEFGSATFAMQMQNGRPPPCPSNSKQTQTKKDAVQRARNVMVHLHFVFAIREDVVLCSRPGLQNFSRCRKSKCTREIIAGFCKNVSIVNGNGGPWMVR